MTVLFNGRFLAAPQTGVQRVARELIQALPEEARVLAPERTAASLDARVAVEKSGRLPGIFWEQLTLPHLARGGLLVNLCNTAPLIAPGIVMIHDAQVHITPESYAPAFARYYRWLQPRLARRAVQVLTVSEYSRQMLARFQVAPVEKIAVVPNGADHMQRVVAEPAILERLGLQAGRFAVAFASTQPHKNTRVLLRAFSRTELAGVTLVLVGRAGRAEFPEAPANVLFAGGVPDGALRALFEHAACALCPSTTEGFGLPPLEAMAVGCPAVAAPCGALPEVLGDAADYAAPDEPEAWAARVVSLLDPERRVSRGAAARLHAARFTWAQSAAKLLEVIRAVEARRAGRNVGLRRLETLSGQRS